MIVVVPNELRDEINRRLDSAYKDMPDAAVDRDYHYKMILSYFNEHGELPEFKLEKANKEKACT